nr:hypothetical protein [Streptomyces sp. IMTB 2501]
MLDTVHRDFGTGALDSRGPGCPPNPRRPAERLVEFAVADGGYRAVCLHTDPAVPGAEAFWRSLGTVVHDERRDAEHPQSLVHFELPVGR